MARFNKFEAAFEAFARMYPGHTFAQMTDDNGLKFVVHVENPDGLCGGKMDARRADDGETHQECSKCGRIRAKAVEIGKIITPYEFDGRLP